MALRLGRRDKASSTLVCSILYQMHMIQTDILRNRSKCKITQCLSGGDGIANCHATSKGRYVRHAMWCKGQHIGGISRRSGFNSSHCNWGFLPPLHYILFFIFKGCLQQIKLKSILRTCLVFYYASCLVFEPQLSEMKDYIQPPKTHKRQCSFRVRITEVFSDSHARGVKFYLATPHHLMVWYRTFNPARNSSL